MTIDLSTYYFPEVEKCLDCNTEYKCICLYDKFHFICLGGCGRRYLKHHPPYKNKFVRKYRIDYEKVTEWYKDHELHNEFGPAVIYETNIKNNVYNKLWYIDGKRVLVDSQKEFENSKEYREWKLNAFK